MSAVLELRGVSKHFGAVRALERVDLSIDPGEIVGLMGDNGAGKSTLVKLVAGSFAASGGELFVGGERARFASPAASRARGVEVVYQDLALCDNLSAAANVFLGRELVRRVLGVRVLDHRAMQRRAEQLFRELDSDCRASDPVRRMSGGQRQAVAIARTRLAEPMLVLMDEPTAAISVRQVAGVLDGIRRLGERGIAVLLVSHRMPDVFAVCSRIVVLRRGAKVADKPIEQSSPEEVTGLVTGGIESA